MVGNKLGAVKGSYMFNTASHCMRCSSFDNSASIFSFFFSTQILSCAYCVCEADRFVLQISSKYDENNRPEFTQKFCFSAYSPLPRPSPSSETSFCASSHCACQHAPRLFMLVTASSIRSLGSWVSVCVSSRKKSFIFCGLWSVKSCWKL